MPNEATAFNGALWPASASGAVGASTRPGRGPLGAPSPCWASRRSAPVSTEQQTRPAQSPCCRPTASPRVCQSLLPLAAASALPPSRLSGPVRLGFLQPACRGGLRQCSRSRPRQVTTCALHRLSPATRRTAGPTAFHPTGGHTASRRQLLVAGSHVRLAAAPAAPVFFSPSRAPVPGWARKGPPHRVPSASTPPPLLCAGGTHAALQFIFPVRRRRTPPAGRSLHQRGSSVSSLRCAAAAGSAAAPRGPGFRWAAQPPWHR